jgi:tetratricopeptide (TPR) repeat protein
MRHMRSKSLAAVFLALAVAPLSAEESSARSQCATLLGEKKLADAEPFCVKAAQESKDGMLLHGDLLALKGDGKGALARYEEIISGYDREKPTPLQLTALRRRAVLHFQMGNASAASDAAAAFLKHQPDNLDLLQIAAMTTPFPTRRLEYADRLVALQADNVGFHVFRSRALIENEKRREALDAIELALKLDPKSDEALMMRGFVHLALGDHAKAVKDHATVARRNPKDPTPRAVHAQSLVDARQYAEAIEIATEALVLKADHGEALTARFYARLAMGDGEGALSDIETMSRAAPDGDWDEARQKARSMIEMQKLMRPESIAALEADRQVIVDTVSAHLHEKCGYYSVRDYEDNEGLSAYRKCILAWYKTEDEAFARSIPAHVVAAGERFEKTLVNLEDADPLACSKMPKKSRCVDDALFARLNAAAAGMADPKDVVGAAEYERINREVHAYNASVKRKNAFIKTASFLDALANELSSQ